MADEFGLTDRIRFAGYSHDLARVLAAMDIFAFTSVEKDTSPLALLSAMSSGLPTVAFDISGVRELFNDKEQLLRVPVGSTEELSAALAKLISDSSLRLRLAKAARQTAEQKFSLQQYVSRVERVLEMGGAAAAEKSAQPGLNGPEPASGSMGLLRNKKQFRYA